MEVSEDKQKMMSKKKKWFKKAALVALATTNSHDKKNKNKKLKRSLSKEPSAMDVLNTFVDESLEVSPLTSLARDKCGIPDAMLLEG